MSREWDQIACLWLEVWWGSTQRIFLSQWKHSMSIKVKICECVCSPETISESISLSSGHLCTTQWPHHSVVTSWESMNRNDTFRKLRMRVFFIFLNSPQVSRYSYVQRGPRGDWWCISHQSFGEKAEIRFSFNYSFLSVLKTPNSLFQLSHLKLIESYLPERRKQI